VSQVKSLFLFLSVELRALHRFSPMLQLSSGGELAIVADGHFPKKIRNWEV
jgi:hypothetical protein